MNFYIKYKERKETEVICFQKTVIRRMDPSWEFTAPQYLDFMCLGEEDQEEDTYFEDRDIFPGSPKPEVQEASQEADNQEAGREAVGRRKRWRKLEAANQRKRWGPTVQPLAPLLRRQGSWRRSLCRSSARRQVTEVVRSQTGQLPR